MVWLFILKFRVSVLTHNHLNEGAVKAQNYQNVPTLIFQSCYKTVFTLNATSPTFLYFFFLSVEVSLNPEDLWSCSFGVLVWSGSY